MVLRCAVEGCKTGRRPERLPGVTLHRFPLHNPSLTQTWVEQIGRRGLVPRYFSRVCSLHFHPHSFTFLTIRKDRFQRKNLEKVSDELRSRRLTNDAVPTIFNQDMKKPRNWTQTQIESFPVKTIKTEDVIERYKCNPVIQNINKNSNWPPNSKFRTISVKLNHNNAEIPFNFEISTSDKNPFERLFKHVTKTEGPFTEIKKMHWKDRELHLELENIDIFGCDECRMGFVTKMNLIEHTSRRHSPSTNNHRHSSNSSIRTGEVFLCDICQKSWKLKSKLNYHLQSHNTHFKGFECLICHKTFKRKDTLKKHEFNVHSPAERKFVCPECGKRFKLNSAMKVHLIVHSNEFPFQCGVCKKSFARKLQLHRHSTNYVCS